MWLNVRLQIYCSEIDLLNNVCLHVILHLIYTLIVCQDFVNKHVLEINTKQKTQTIKIFVWLKQTARMVFMLILTWKHVLRNATTKLMVTMEYVIPHAQQPYYLQIHKLRHVWRHWIVLMDFSLIVWEKCVYNFVILLHKHSLIQQQKLVRKIACRLIMLTIQQENVFLHVPISLNFFLVKVIELVLKTVHLILLPMSLRINVNLVVNLDIMQINQHGNV